MTRANSKIEIQSLKLLIVEGTHERLFFESLCRHRTISNADIQILDIGGKTELPASLQALIRDPKFPDVVSLAVIRDADLPEQPDTAGASMAARAFQSVCGSLGNANLQHPSAHGQYASGTPRVGVFIMPDGTSDGMLETLCVQSVLKQPHFECVNKFFECLASQQIQVKNKHKAKAHAYIASCPNPDVHVGVAAREGYWDLGDAAFDDITTFVSAL